MVSGVQCWQRTAVAEAGLQCFCSWMVTFTDVAVEDFARVALSLAAAGCSWLQAESQHVLQVLSELGAPQIQQCPDLLYVHTMESFENDFITKLCLLRSTIAVKMCALHAIYCMINSK